MFCSEWCFPLIRRGEILHIERPWKGINKHFVEKKRKHLTISQFILGKFCCTILLSSWCGRRMSIFQNFHASKLSCQGYPNSMWQTSRALLTPQCGGTVHAIQEHFVFQKCHLKMNSLGKWFWLIEILRFFFPDCSLSVTEIHNCRQNFFVVICGVFFSPFVLQLRKCLPSLEINLGSWPLCCKISYNTAVSIRQLIDRDIFPPACIRSLGHWPMSAQALFAAWSVSKVPAIFFLWLYTAFFILWWKMML